MASRVRAGNPTAFWNAAAVGAGATSAEVEISRSTEHVVIYVTTNAATTITLEVAPHSKADSEGIWPEEETGSTWFTLVSSGAAATPYQHVFAGAGSVALMIPDFVPGMLRLKTSGAATLTAGYESIGD